MKNPRVYHGTHQETAFLSTTNREMRNYESIGTWVTTDIEHAKCFGPYVYQLDYPETLKFYVVDRFGDLSAPFLDPAVSQACHLISQKNKDMLRKAFILNPKTHPVFGNRSYEDIEKLTDKKLREIGDDTYGRFVYLQRVKPPKDLNKVLAEARDFSREKLFHNKKFALFLYDYYTKRGYDGIAWIDTNIDAGFHESLSKEGKDHYRQSQYLIFYPDQYQFSPAD